MSCESKKPLKMILPPDVEGYEDGDYEESEETTAFRRQQALEKVTWERYAVFVRAMKRLGYPHNRAPGLDEVTPDLIHKEIHNQNDHLDEEDENDRDFWTVERIERELYSYRRGKIHLGEGFRQRYAKVKESFLDLVAKAQRCYNNGGSEEVEDQFITPEDVFDQLDSSIKDSLPLHAVELHLCTVTTSRWPLKGRKYYVPNTSSSGGNRERFETKCVIDWKNAFPKVVKRLGGKDHVSNVAAEDFYKLILEELEQQNHKATRVISSFSCQDVKETIRTYLSTFGYFEWSSFEHHLLLEAVKELGGDPLDQVKVRPELLLKVMVATAGGNSDAWKTLNLHAVDFHLEKLRLYVKDHQPAQLILHKPERLKRSFDESSCSEAAQT